MALKDYAGKHSSEWPETKSQYDSVIIGAFAPEPRPYDPSAPVQLVGPPPDRSMRDAVLCIPNRERGGADAVIVVSDDGVWVKGLDEYIERRVVQEIAKLEPGELAKLLDAAHGRGE